MRFRGPLLEAEFIGRENRFATLVRMDGRDERVHIPNTGRMRELLMPGATVLLVSSVDRQGVELAGEVLVDLGAAVEVVA